MASTTKNFGLTKPEATDNLDPTIFANNFATIDSAMISTYTHKKTGTVHNFVGNGPNGKVKIEHAFNVGDSFAINGVTKPAYCGKSKANGTTITKGRWVTFIYDGTAINFNSGGSGGVGGCYYGLVERKYVGNSQYEDVTGRWSFGDYITYIDHLSCKINYDCVVFIKAIFNYNHWENDDQDFYIYKNDTVLHHHNSGSDTGGCTDYKVEGLKCSAGDVLKIVTIRPEGGWVVVVEG